MDKKKKETSASEERIELAQKLSDWVNEDPSERACVCILGNGESISAVVVGNRRLCVEFTASAINTKESEVRRVVMESLMLSAISKVSKE